VFKIKKYILVVAMGILLTACLSINRVEKKTNYSLFIENTLPNEKLIIERDYSKSTVVDENYIIMIVCEKLQKIDFSPKQSVMNLKPEAAEMYKKAYLNVLKNKIPLISKNGEKEYFRNLYKIGTEFEELDDSYTYYYDDLDNDGFPELGIKSTGYTCILKYEQEINEFKVLFSNPSMYITILGNGRLWYHDGLHSGTIRDEYIVLNSNSKWETVFTLEQGIDTFPFYCVSIDEYKNINLDEELWKKVTTPFFNETPNAIHSKNFHEIFGELL